MPAAPLIIYGISAAASAYAAKKAQDAAGKRSTEEQAALTGAQGTAGALSQTGQGLVTAGQATQAPATNYFTSLLQGNRAQQSQAIAAPRAALTDVYRGAEQNLTHSGIRGPQRDLASAELGRQRAGQIGGLVTGVQPAAASALTQIGQTQTGQGAPMLGQAGSIYSGLLGQGARNREYARGEGEKAGAGYGGLIFDLLRQTQRGRSTGGGYPTGGGGGFSIPSDTAGWG